MAAIHVSSLDKAAIHYDLKVLIAFSQHHPLNEVLLYSELHEHFLSVPEPIRLYIEEVKTQLLMLTNYNGPSMTLKEKWEFIKLTRHAFGRTALVLSGGGALGAFHLVCIGDLPSSMPCCLKIIHVCKI